MKYFYAGKSWSKGLVYFETKETPETASYANHTFIEDIHGSIVYKQRKWYQRDRKYTIVPPRGL